MSKRHTVIAKRTRASAKYWERATTLLAQRDKLMDEIAQARASAPFPLAKKASALLTRYWAAASWEAREELLRAARWLFGVGRMQLVMAASKGSRTKTTAPVKSTAKPRRRAATSARKRSALHHAAT